MSHIEHHETTSDLSIRNGHISSDNDQGMGMPVGCTRFECSEWIDGVQHRVKLIKNPQSGFWICPNCHHSYGSGA
jgi:hypothetical protein